MNKKKIVLFQPYLRKHILNLGNHLEQFEFVLKAPPISHNSFYSKLPSFEDEIHRSKTGWISKFRRFFGILNLRIKFDSKADAFLTYGCFLITNKPYCLYIENGVAPYNYDIKIAHNPIARIIFSIIIRMPQCKYLIFMSQAAQKSFLNSAPYSPATKTIIQKKSVQVYPLVKTSAGSIKKFDSTLKLLFVGMFYMKGGVELCHAFVNLRKKYDNIKLTIVTPLRTIKEGDLEWLRSQEDLTLVEANLDESKMQEMYKNHHVFVLPTYREGFGLVLIEAIAYGMPVITTDQFATVEMAIQNYNAFVYPIHPLKDYNPKTYQLSGKYHNPKDFYADLFRLQKENALRPIEDFIYTSIEAFLLDPKLLEKYSQNSLDLYNKKFHQAIISERIEATFLEAIEK